MKSFRLMGLMSGTSLDGLDIVDVTFELTDEDRWSFKINNAETFSFDEEISTKLKNVTTLNSSDLTCFSSQLGKYYGQKVNAFILKYKIEKDELLAVSSHGHTVYHQPKKGYTLQIGNGPEGAIISGLEWICDFRTKDVALGGNGAPLVPIGDKLLFSEYADGFLNLGGFSNLTYQENKQWKAYDVSPVNLILNHLSKTISNLSYDKDGELGKKGKLDTKLLSKLNALSYYSESAPKSLGVEWLNEFFLPIIHDSNTGVNELTTVYHHIAEQVSLAIRNSKLKSVLITGGGAKNKFLIELIKEKSAIDLLIPDEDIIDFKEAVVFAFLGLLRKLNKTNVISSVTGAKNDSVSGIIHRP